MPSIVADTHIVVWFLEEPARLSEDAANALENAAANPGDKIIFSAISLIEIQYLIEKHRIPTSVLTNLLSELDYPDPLFELAPVDLNIGINITRISRNDIPEMPDRSIAATALFLNLPLITADNKIRSSGVKVIW